MNMEGTKRTPLSARKKLKRKISKRFVRSIVTYLKSDAYLYAPLFSDLSPLPPQMHTPPPSNSESSKAEDLPVAGKTKIKNLATMEVSTMRVGNRNLRSDISEHTLHNGRISSSKRSLVILDGQRTEKKRLQPDPRRVPIE